MTPLGWRARAAEPNARRELAAADMAVAVRARGAVRGPDGGMRRANADTCEEMRRAEIMTALLLTLAMVRLMRDALVTCCGDVLRPNVSGMQLRRCLSSS